MLAASFLFFLLLVIDYGLPLGNRRIRCVTKMLLQAHLSIDQFNLERRCRRVLRGVQNRIGVDDGLDVRMGILPTPSLPEFAGCASARVPSTDQQSRLVGLLSVSEENRIDRRRKPPTELSAAGGRHDTGVEHATQCLDGDGRQRNFDATLVQFSDKFLGQKCQRIPPRPREDIDPERVFRARRRRNGGSLGL